MADLTFLVADIGATSARFGLGGADGVRQCVELSTGEFSRADDLVMAAVEALDAPSVDAACLAVAGPVQAGVAKMTNRGQLRFDQLSLSVALGCSVRVVNDFYALALAVPVAQSLTQIGGAAADGAKAIIGPGSGLGMAGLIAQDVGWLVLASEGGHGDLAPGSPLEVELLSILQRRYGHVCWETVLSGPGLVRLHEVMAELQGAAAPSLSGPEIIALGAGMDDLLCHQTLETFFGLLGSAAGNLALTLCASGGVYIGGGIVPQLVAFAQSSALRRRFEERGALTGYVRNIPLFVMLDEAPGLAGALQCLLLDPHP